MTSSAKIIYMTQAEYDALIAEIDDLEGRGRHEVAEAISYARAFGDPAENAEYQSARDEQTVLETRIAKLRDRLLHTEVVEAVGRVVSIGSLVEIESAGKPMRFLISNVVGEENGIQSISPFSPVGSALMGKKAGDEAEIKAPRGSWTAKIKSVRKG